MRRYFDLVNLVLFRFIHSLLVSCSLFLNCNPSLQVYFLLLEEHPRHSFTESLLVVSSVFICSKIALFVKIVKGQFGGYNIPGWQLFPVNVFRILLSIVCARRLQSFVDNFFPSLRWLQKLFSLLFFNFSTVCLHRDYFSLLTWICCAFWISEFVLC